MLKKAMHRAGAPLYAEALRFPSTRPMPTVVTTDAALPWHGTCEKGQVPRHGSAPLAGSRYAAQRYAKTHGGSALGALHHQASSLA